LCLNLLLAILECSLLSLSALAIIWAEVSWASREEDFREKILGAAGLGSWISHPKCTANNPLLSQVSGFLRIYWFRGLWGDSCRPMGILKNYCSRVHL
jgi:hypothetical protein